MSNTPHRLRGLAPLLALATLLAGPGGARAEEPLPPAEVFRYELTDLGDAVRVDWTILPGYYLYKRKLGFASLTPSIALGEPLLPRGESHEDEYFGAQEIYRERASVEVPYTGSGELELEVKSQGCADAGLCYTPQTWTRRIALGGSGTATGLFGQRREPAVQTLGDSGFLPPDAAFQPFLTLLDGRTLEVAWRIEPGYYLYRDKLTVEALDGAVALEAEELPPGKVKYDEYFGETQVYYDSAFFNARIRIDGAAPGTLGVALGYQGCAEDGICYPPLTRHATIDLARLTAAVLPADAAPPAGAGTSGGATAAGGGIGGSAAAAPAGKESIQDRLARTIREGHLALVMGLFFVAGLGLALTPCVLPMIPILSGIIAGDGEKTTPMRGFMLSLTYVLGMALTYTVAGALFALAGQQAQAVFQQPWILVLFAALFVALAASMFGLFELQMPSSIQSRLGELSGRQRSGTVVGAFVMGALSSLIVTACVAPPLVAALAVIGQSGDVVRGGLALFSMSMGMGAPLLVVGASAGTLLPKAGPWMVAVKGAFGFLMLGLAIYILERLLPGSIILALWALLVFMGGVFLGALTPLTPESGTGAKLGKGFGVLALLYGATLLLGSLTGGHDPLRPLAGVAVGGGGAAQAETHLEFRRVKTVAELDGLLADAASRGQPVMLDFYADWCVSCKEMEKYTFTDPAVQTTLAGTLLLQADVTANDDDDQAMLKRFGLFGPPSIIFYGPDGAERPAYRVVGMMWPDEFAPHAAEAIGDRGALAARAD